MPDMMTRPETGDVSVYEEGEKEGVSVYEEEENESMSVGNGGDRE
ncbi:uncharacterized protein G2W53_003875 [Senna tora]|uniref:Uncharacterized protein n=1 Tax=Senna tora TaxID=362788 RepID=A0A835CJN5_9FABA|nr:uncharacterized protein G2W53_003875 [Senna tora]